MAIPVHAGQKHWHSQWHTIRSSHFHYSMAENALNQGACRGFRSLRNPSGGWIRGRSRRVHVAMKKVERALSPQHPFTASAEIIQLNIR